MMTRLVIFTHDGVDRLNSEGVQVSRDNVCSQEVLPSVCGNARLVRTY